MKVKDMAMIKHKVEMEKFYLRTSIEYTVLIFLYMKWLISVKDRL